MANNFNVVGNAAARGIENVDSRLVAILQAAAARTPYQVQVFSGKRGGGGASRHDHGQALDIVLIDPATGREIPNMAAGGPAFQAYEDFAKAAREVQQSTYPELSDSFRWGGYFGPSGLNPRGFDLMHFDLRPGGSMAMGSWDSGLNDRGQQALSGLGTGTIYSTRGTNLPGWDFQPSTAISAINSAVPPIPATPPSGAMALSASPPPTGVLTDQIDLPRPASWVGSQPYDENVESPTGNTLYQDYPRRFYGGDRADLVAPSPLPDPRQSALPPLPLGPEQTPTGAPGDRDPVQTAIAGMIPGLPPAPPSNAPAGVVDQTFSALGMPSLPMPQNPDYASIYRQTRTMPSPPRPMPRPDRTPIPPIQPMARPPQPPAQIAPRPQRSGLAGLLGSLNAVFGQQSGPANAGTPTNVEGALASMFSPLPVPNTPIPPGTRRARVPTDNGSWEWGYLPNR